MTDRERFEEWAIPRGYNVYYGHEYHDQETQRAWLAWQAAVTAERKRMVERCTWTEKTEVTHEIGGEDHENVFYVTECGRAAGFLVDRVRPCWCGKRIEIKEAPNVEAK